MPRIAALKSYDLLAIEAAKRAGVKVPDGGIDAQSGFVAKDDAAREARDAAWAEYELMLMDTQTWSLRQIRSWLADEWGVKVGNSSVDRARRQIRRKQRVNELACARVKAALDCLEHLPVEETFRSGQHFIARMILGTLVNYSEADLADMKPSQVIAMMDTFYRGAKVFGDTELQRQRLAEMQRKFDEAMSRAAGQAAGAKGLTREKIAEIRKAVFGEAA